MASDWLIANLGTVSSFIEIATSRFVNVSNEDIPEFLKENENKNTARKTSQDVVCDM